MRFQMGRVDHQYIGLITLPRQFDQDTGEHTLAAPTHPSVVQRLWWAIFTRCISPTQPIAIDEDNPAQHALVIHPRLAMRLWKEGLKTLHLFVGQPEKVTQITAPILEQ